MAVNGPVQYFEAAFSPPVFDHLIRPDSLSSCWGLVNLIYPLTASICLVYLMRNFLSPRFKYPWLSGGLFPFFLHLFTAAVMGWEPGINRALPGTFLLWYLIFLIMICCLLYRGGWTEKLYLAVTFYTFYLLTIQMLEYTGHGLFQLTMGVRLPFVREEPRILIYNTCPLFYQWFYQAETASPAVYNSIFCLISAGACALLVFVSRYLSKKLKNRTRDMGWKELSFLLLPEGAGISFYSFMTFVKPLLFEDRAVDQAKSYGPVIYYMIPALTLAFLLAILYSCDIYEQILDRSEEREKAAMLAGEMEQLEKHIRDLEQIHAGIRSMKHDMKNYMFDIKSLLRTRGIEVDEDEGLGVYFSGVGKALDQFDYTCRTGNPVTDVVVNGKCRQARQMGISFSCTFCFPETYNISAFDISVILNNALNNALEACSNLREQRPEELLFIEAEAYCKNNMFFIEIRNSFDGVLSSGRKSGFPGTRKKDTCGHGLGLENIRQCADKYLGAVEFTHDEKQFCLTVMLQRVWES